MNLRSIFGRKKTPPPLALDPVLRRQIRTSFDEASGNEEHFPSTIDPRIYHVQLIARYFGEMNDKLALDAGCGKGRFARVLIDQNPQAVIVGMDLALAMLRSVPSPALPCCGTLTQYPFRDQSFDFAYATESLEHAVDIEAAIAEISAHSHGGDLEKSVAGAIALRGPSFRGGRTIATDLQFIEEP